MHGFGLLIAYFMLIILSKLSTFFFGGGGGGTYKHDVKKHAFNNSSQQIHFSLMFLEASGIKKTKIFSFAK